MPNNTPVVDCVGEPLPAKQGSECSDLAGESVVDRFDLGPTCMTVVGADGKEVGEVEEGGRWERGVRAVLTNNMPDCV